MSTNLLNDVHLLRSYHDQHQSVDQKLVEPHAQNCLVKLNQHLYQKIPEMTIYLIAQWPVTVFPYPQMHYLKNPERFEFLIWVIQAREMALLCLA